MNVLSLFDGLSCGQIALNRIGIKYDKYFASEVDEFAIRITQKKYPSTIQLGDVRNIKGTDLPKIDLLFGGSPCTGFSITGKQLNFNDPQSKLFFEYVRLLKEIKPKYFLLENVVMKQQYMNIITENLGVHPIILNSSKVSAQNRERLYWTNIVVDDMIIDKNIEVKDILVDKYEDKYKMTEKNLAHVKRDFGSKGKEITGRKKCNCLTAAMGTGGGNVPYLNDRGVMRKLTPLECERLQTIDDNYTDGVSDSQRYKMIGNGWTVDIICHILKGIKSGNTKEVIHNKQLNFV